MIILEQNKKKGWKMQNSHIFHPFLLSNGIYKPSKANYDKYHLPLIRKTTAS